MNKKTEILKNAKLKNHKTKLTLDQNTNLNATFTNGVGELKAFLYRKGTLINEGRLNSTGTITFPSVKSDDVIVLNGTCTGKAKIEIDVKTFPATPMEFEKEDINCLIGIK